MSETKVMPISELPENQVNGSSIQKIEEQHAPLPPQEKNSDQNNPPSTRGFKIWSILSNSSSKYYFKQKIPAWI